MMTAPARNKLLELIRAGQGVDEGARALVAYIEEIEADLLAAQNALQAAYAERDEDRATAATLRKLVNDLNTDWHAERLALLKEPNP